MLADAYITFIFSRYLIYFLARTIYNILHHCRLEMNYVYSRLMIDTFREPKQN
jgi:hypothetical protein